MDPDICRPAQVRRVPVSLGLAGPPDLHDEFPTHRELEYLVIGTVATNPDVVVVVHEDAVFRLGPMVLRARSAPSLFEVAVRVELEYRRRGHRRFFRGQRTRPLEYPHVIPAVHGHAGHDA